MELSKFKYLLLLLLATLTSCLGRTVHEKTVPLFIFGDSLFDAGNNNYINTTTAFQANFTPYGKTFFSYPTGRFCDGRTIADFIAEYAHLPLIKPYLQHHNPEFAFGTNFASAGAGALADTYPGLVIHLKKQLSYFRSVKKQLVHKLGDTEANKLVSNAVYLFSIGNNDYISLYESNSTFTHERFVKKVIGTITTVIEGIYKMGGRKFAFPNLPPLGCFPFAKELIQGNQCIQEMTNLVKLHNEALDKTLQTLEMELKGFKYSYFDLYTALSNIMENPSKYGFKEGEKACCGSGEFRGTSSCGGKRGIKEYELCENPSEYVFFDFSHPSQSAYQQAAALFWSGASKFTWPYNLYQLFHD